MLYSLIYVSSASQPFTTAELTKLLQGARERNTSLGVSGMLLYKDGNFMQLLEGEEEAVLSLYRLIAGDTRHKGAMTLLKGSVQTRSFPDWSMGFRDLHAPGEDLPGYSDFLNTPLNSGEFVTHPSQAQKLLLMFKEKM
jgi:Sensors of blue-light using FAD